MKKTMEKFKLLSILLAGICLLLIGALAGTVFTGILVGQEQIYLDDDEFDALGLLPLEHTDIEFHSFTLEEFSHFKNYDFEDLEDFYSFAEEENYEIEEEGEDFIVLYKEEGCFYETKIQAERCYEEIIEAVIEIDEEYQETFAFVEYSRLGEAEFEEDEDLEFWEEFGEEDYE